MDEPKARLKATIMDESAMRRAITRIAHEVIETNQGAGSIALLGIVRRGKVLAELLADQIELIEGTRPPLGTLDISFYRDDYTTRVAPVLQATSIPYKVDGRDIVLVDDVLFTGRTVRSALDAIMDYGRPATIQLVVMVDRGHRELPIRADYVGKNVPSSHTEDVRVCLPPIDDHMAVEIWDVPERPSRAGKGE
ncbi:MAG: bifunctional pyr operon transcriptional regulator/uracil phosphoribosyltransferase PyrR [Atopobiaceae bacterium]|jgi:pyrimidine operon attenuation protein/uracil phosphoribosyltransferase|nr:bifunctional pyr operon transcriptional regulator/uracil phosphoribosyltransferase PyrR [Atopobiaceae bacterium]MCH4120132.1 bifunctional pyr operon transcriptional regulator/uracil phosphoribosyltransferase PyrR [Atopobiaceae bacterium]MCI1317777.1 bifunctional pyr operon transcriptional regulator/uracil phosphoribosyltransferase PyrR [Atopobiaceae bacterium]MCI1388352.1 bifunctional pyr operon transcriptional regulator/uracil phosphoribosyltransferase PyrR [Atopobiaceae bacterium]MCI143139